MKNDVVRWTSTSSSPTSTSTSSSSAAHHKAATMTVIETISAMETKSSHPGSSNVVKHHKSPRCNNILSSPCSSSSSLSSLSSSYFNLPPTIVTNTSPSKTMKHKTNRKNLINCDRATQLTAFKSTKTTTTTTNINASSKLKVWRQPVAATHRRSSSSSSLRSSLTIFDRPQALFVNKRTDFTKFLVLCLKISVVLCLCSLNVGVVGVGADDDSEFEKNPSTPGGHFTHTWAVHVPNGEVDGLADRVARDHGFINLGKIFDDHYHFEHSRLSKRSALPADHHQKRLEDDDRVNWAKQQVAKRRQKRDFIRMRPSRTSPRSLSLVDSMHFSDPKWPQMWYLNRGGGLDMNVIPAWKEGITGKGVVVTILDDGLESDHPDIDANFDPQASYDVNGHDADPMPHYDMTDSNRHGTRCAGEVAATANNSICAVGIAYGASVGGVRMLDGDVTDAVEARSLSLNPQHIDIYSASWGPDDDGKTVDGPGELASRAFIEGVTKGRNGKGSIFIWASGNGGRELDNCNCDGYTNSIWTLSISSATEEGHVPWYSEKCSSTLATTYSSGGQTEKQVVTTDLHHSCTVSHTGTSASAPLAAGIAALVLESNSNLTWRDLQHIVVRTAKPANLKDPSWSKNGVGRRISHSFGYGLMDAAAMVQLARNWKTVPEQQRCEINAPHVDKIIQAKGYITLQLTVKHCLSVNYLEHVQAKITLTSHRRGDIQLYLKSPAGTKVTLLTSRLHDVSRSGFSQWPFMSVHTWGESPHGNWQLEIHNEGRYIAQITQWDLIFYGTETPAQPDDPVQISPGQFGSSFGGDVEHNLLEFDPETASGQWRNVQQVGESLADIQHENDQTNNACMRISLDQKCIDCRDTYLYNGRCYTKCPEKTFPLNEMLPNEHDLLLKDPDELQQLVNARSIFAKTESENEDNSRNMCGICDKSCLKCTGPSPSQCTLCFPESRLKTLNSHEGYCFVFSERSSGDDNARTESKSNWKYVPAVFLLFFIPTMFVVVMFSVAMVIRKKFTLKTAYQYDRVAFNVGDDEIRALTGEEEEEEIDGTNSGKDLKREDVIIPNREQIVSKYKLVADSELSDSEEEILNVSKS